MMSKAKPIDPLEVIVTLVPVLIMWVYGCVSLIGGQDQATHIHGLMLIMGAAIGVWMYKQD